MVGTETNRKEIAKFAFSIFLYLDDEEQVIRQVSSVNSGVPKEIIITNMKEFLQRLEKEFSEEFGTGIQ